MTTTEPLIAPDALTVADGRQVAVLTAKDADLAMFTVRRSTMGKAAGYDEDEVDEFIDRVAATLYAYEAIGADLDPTSAAWHVREATRLLTLPKPTALEVQRAIAHNGTAVAIRLGGARVTGTAE